MPVAQIPRAEDAFALGVAPGALSRGRIIEYLHQNGTTGHHGVEMESLLQVPLSHADAQDLAAQLERARARHLRMGDRAVMVLREIGRPATYDRIWTTYQDLFPGAGTSRRTLYAAISRRGDITRVGYGTYSLREWARHRSAA